MGCRQGTIFLKMVASISSSLGITASIASGSVIERATFLTIWAKKRQVFVPKAATFSFHLQHNRLHDHGSQFPVLGELPSKLLMYLLSGREGHQASGVFADLPQSYRTCAHV